MRPNRSNTVAMKITLRLLAAAAAAAVLGVTPAHAVIGGTLDTTHTYVGQSVFFPGAGHPVQCSGFLVSAQLYVTAAHCAAAGPGPVFVMLWFGAGPNPPGTPPDALGIASASPAWSGVLPNHDIGVVHLFEPMPGPYATLASPGFLDRLASKRGQQNVSFTSVGYGVADYGPTGFIAPFMRVAGSMQLEHLTDIDLFTTAAPGNGTGGGATCLGDSGGPVFSGDVVVALVSAGTKYCNGKAADFRLDTVEAHDFIFPPGP